MAYEVTALFISKTADAFFLEKRRKYLTAIKPIKHHNKQLLLVTSLGASHYEREAQVNGKGTKLIWWPLKGPL